MERNCEERKTSLPKVSCFMATGKGLVSTVRAGTTTLQ